MTKCCGGPGGRGPQHFESPPNLERKAFNHMPVSMVRRMLGRKKFETYFSFAIERNPWDAVVSLYHWRFRDSEPGLVRRVRRLGGGRDVRDQERADLPDPGRRRRRPGAALRVAG